MFAFTRAGVTDELVAMVQRVNVILLSRQQTIRAFSAAPVFFLFCGLFTIFATFGSFGFIPLAHFQTARLRTLLNQFDRDQLPTIKSIPTPIWRQGTAPSG